MEEYKLKVLLKERSYIVIIQKKQYGFWTTIGNFRIREQNLLVMDKHENWREVTSLTNLETFWKITRAKIADFYRITQDALSYITDSDFITSSEETGLHFLIYVNEY